MKKLKLKILPKTFIGSLSLIIGVVVIAFVFINILTPRFYRAYKEDMLNTDLNNLAFSFENKDIAAMVRALEEFARNHDEYGVSLYRENGDIVFSRSLETRVEHIYSVEESAVESGGSSSVSVVGDGTRDSANGERTLTASDGSVLILTLYSSMQPVDEVSVVLFRVLPYVLLISIILSAAVSFIYAKTITAPIKAISSAAVNMRTLEKGAKCEVKSFDEIGELAGNINELYGRLLTTINDLQNEMQNVAAAEKEKIDFMLTVSHELKTPLTSVKGMVEGMIYNVGVYKDRDEYLNRCGENIDALTSLVNEVLDASKLELSPSPEDYTDTNIQELVKDTAAAYEMIALSKQIGMAIDISEDISRLLPAGLFSKALSNIISNALKHTAPGGAVNIYNDKDSLVIENTCVPLSPEEVRRVFEPFYKTGDNSGHGLGLYLTERILKVCGLPFQFTPFDKGMRFIIYMN